MHNGFGSFEHQQTCLNGGITLTSGGCECKDMYTGIHCENKVVVPVLKSLDSPTNKPEDNDSLTTNSLDDNTTTSTTTATNSLDDNTTTSTTTNSVDDRTSSVKSNSIKQYEYSYLMLFVTSLFFLMM